MQNKEYQNQCLIKGQEHKIKTQFNSQSHPYCICMFVLPGKFYKNYMDLERFFQI